jgi:hypothetical protein
MFQKLLDSLLGSAAGVEAFFFGEIFSQVDTRRA